MSVKVGIYRKNAWWGIKGRVHGARIKSGLEGEGRGRRSRSGRWS